MTNFYHKFLSIGNRVQNKIFLPFIAMMLIIGALIIYTMTDLVSANVEARVTEKLNNDIRLIQEIVTDMEKRLGFYAQFMADTEKLAGHISEEKDSRLILIYLLEFLRGNRIACNIGGPGDIDMADSDLKRLGTLGVRSTGLTTRKEGTETKLAIAAVAPIEGRLSGRSVITVSRDLDQELLLDLCKKTGAHKIQVFFGGEFVESSRVEEECDACVREMLASKYKSKNMETAGSYVGEYECLDHIVKMMVAPLIINFKEEALVAVFESIDDLHRAKRNIFLITVAAVGLMLLVIVPIYARTVSKTIRPIRELSRASRAVAEGNLNQHVSVKTTDEVGELSRSFNKMVSDLNKYREELEDWNQTLEERVAERGQQLAEAQAKLIQASKLAAVGELAAGIAHELNNPLAGIYAFLQVFEETIRSRGFRHLSEEDARSFEENFGYVEREIQRCKSTISSLLKFARVSRKDYTRVDLNSVIRDILGFLQRNLEKDGIEMTVDLGKDLPPVKGDFNELQQVFLNLIVNARKAITEHGKIGIVTRLDRESYSVRTSVSDTGEGIKGENLDKIFDPFFTTRKPGEGTGLGLSISYGIIKDHKGEILVESVEGKGSTFTVILPGLETDEGLDVPATAAGASGKDNGKTDIS